MAGPLGSTPGIIVGVGVGTAAAAAIEPAIERPRQAAWARNPVRELDPGVMARLVAQGAVTLEAAHEAAAAEGFSNDKLDALVYLSQTVPGFAEALMLWRRNPQSFEDLWHHALTKAGLDQRYLPYLDQLETDRLSPPVIALAIVRGIIEDPGFLPVGPPTTEGNVPAFPTSSIDALEEARAHGFDRERLFVQAAITGRPMSPEAAAHAVFRGIIEEVDYRRAVAEGDVRNEWADAIFEATRYITTPATAAGLRIRGWIDAAESYRLGALSGASPETMDNLFLDRGRPATTHQVHIGYARGGRLAEAGDDEREAFTRAIQESDIRPEWTDVLWAGRYTMPSAFVERGLAQSGALSRDEVEQDLLFMGWMPERASKVADFWSRPAGATGKEATLTVLVDEYVTGFMDEAQLREGLANLGYAGDQLEIEVRHAQHAAVKSERARAITGLHRKFQSGDIDATRAATALGRLSMTPDAIERVIDFWTIERDP